MESELRPTGIAGVGARPWGTHFCLFYEAKADLLDLLIPYLKTGLEQHEFCLYVASEPLLAEEAERALRAAVPELDRYQSEGQIEVISHVDLYLTGGHFDPLQVRQGWIDRLNQSLARGYAGMRLLANHWLQRADWDRFAIFEGMLDEGFRGRRIMALCAYALDQCSASDVFDVVRHHQFTLAKRDGRWETLEGAELRRAHDEIEQLNVDLERRVMERTAALASANEQLRVEVVERQRAEAAAREDQRRWQALFEGSIDAILVFADDWNIVDANPAACLLLGFPREELLTLSATDLLLNRMPAVEQALGQELSFKGRLSGEYTVLRKDGATREIEFRVIGHFRPGLHLSLFHDISGRKQAEAALRESEQRFSTAFHASPVPQAITRVTDGTLIDVNDAFRQLFGYERREVIGRTALDFQLYAEPEVRPEIIRTLQEGRPVRGAELRMRTKSGAIVDILLYSELIELAGEPCVLGVGFDVTDRKRAEETIRRQSARAQLLADVSQTFSEAGLDYEAVLKIVAGRTAELIGDACVVFQLSEDRTDSRAVAFYHADPEVLALMRALLLNAWSGRTDTPIAQTVLAGKSVRLPVVTPQEIRPSIQPEFWPFIDRVGLYSLLVVPLRAQDQVIGTISLSRDQPGRPYTLDDEFLLQELADRAALTIQNARLFQVVREHRNQLRVLSARLVEAQEAERRHLARELHDEIGQVLTGLKVMLQLSRRRATDGVQDSLDQAQQLVGQLMDQIQELSLDLRPTMLDDLGLVPAVVDHIERYTQQTGIHVEFQQRAADRRFSAQVETAAYRIIQEALTNVARHAGVQQVAVHVGVNNATLSVQIDDAGTGFDPLAVLAAPTSSGLSGMRERAELLGAELTIESSPGAGTQITVEFPLHG